VYFLGNVLTISVLPILGRDGVTSHLQCNTEWLYCEESVYLEMLFDIGQWLVHPVQYPRQWTCCLGKHSQVVDRQHQWWTSAVKQIITCIIIIILSAKYLH